MMSNPKRRWAALALAIGVGPFVVGRGLTGSQHRARVGGARNNKRSPGCAGYPFHLPAFLAVTGLGGRPPVIVVPPVQP